MAPVKNVDPIKLLGYVCTFLELNNNVYSKTFGRRELLGQKNKKRIREVREVRVGKSGKERVKEGKSRRESENATKP